MSLDTKEKIIGDHKYSVTQFGTIQGLMILRTLKDEVGVSVAQGITGVLASGDGTVILSTIIRELCKGLDEVKFVEFIKRMIEQSGARQDGVEILPVFNDMFAGEYDDLFALLGFIMEVNYHKLLAKDGIGSLLETAIKELTILRESLPTKESPEQPSSPV